MDWNWFFSTLSQSSAAIVGLLGAFLVSAIISRENDFQKLRRDYDELLEEIQFSVARIANLNIDWFNQERRKIVTETDEYEELVYKSQQKPIRNVINKVIVKLSFSPYDKIDEIRTLIRDDMGTNRSNKVNLLVSNFPTAQYYSMVREERENIDKERANAQALSVKVRNAIHRMKSFPQSRHLINYAIGIDIFLFFAGVIYPITFLPTDGQPILASIGDFGSTFFHTLFSLKGIILSIVSIGFIVFQSLFISKNNRQQFSKEQIDELIAFTRLKGYSQNFKAFEDYMILTQVSK